MSICYEKKRSKQNMKTRMLTVLLIANQGKGVYIKNSYSSTHDWLQDKNLQ